LFFIVFYFRVFGVFFVFDFIKSKTIKTEHCISATLCCAKIYFCTAKHSKMSHLDVVPG